MQCSRSVSDSNQVEDYETDLENSDDDSTVESEELATTELVVVWW